MKNNIIVGVSALKETVVSDRDTAANYGSGSIEVYATPAMIALMENTAKDCVDLHLPLGYTTVGIEINIKHIKATPVGMKVKCEAILDRVEDKKLTFKVEAWDKKGKIGEGTHLRYIVNAEEFMNRVKNKE